MGIKIDRSEGKCIITCEGDVSREQVRELRMSFIKMLIDVDELSFDLQNIANADLPLVQLLCSAHRSATRLNKRFVFLGVRPEILEATAASAGYLRQVGCKLDKGNTCLWTDQYHRRER